MLSLIGTPAFVQLFVLTSYHTNRHKVALEHRSFISTSYLDIYTADHAQIYGNIFTMPNGKARISARSVSQPKRDCSVLDCLVVFIKFFLSPCLLFTQMCRALCCLLAFCVYISSSCLTNFNYYY